MQHSLVPYHPNHLIISPMDVVAVSAAWLVMALSNSTAKMPLLMILALRAMARRYKTTIIESLPLITWCVKTVDRLLQMICSWTSPYTPSWNENYSWMGEYSRKSIASPGSAALLYQHDWPKPLQLPRPTCNKGVLICFQTGHSLPVTIIVACSWVEIWIIRILLVWPVVAWASYHAFKIVCWTSENLIHWREASHAPFEPPLPPSPHTSTS